VTPFEHIVSALLAAIGAWLNAVAGGGTFLTFPLLTFLGLTALQANIISTIALWPGAVASAFAYRTLWISVWRQLYAFILVSLIGSACGAWLLLHLPESSFEALVPWLLLFAALLLSFGQRLKNKLKPETANGLSTVSILSNKRSYCIMLFFQFLIAIYGGYFGAGIGVLMLAVLQFAPLQNIHEMNAVKVVLGSAINAVAFFIFIMSGKVNWDVGVWMLIGGVLGGYVGTRISLNISPDFIKRMVLIIAWMITLIYFVLYFY
jgi:uncharacterized membrane protein YfcA